MTTVPCLDCGRLTTNGSRCPDHDRSRKREVERRRPEWRRVYRSARWRRLKTVVLREWVEQHGLLCPGWGDVAPHVSTDLTVDHVEPLSKGGAPYSRSNCAVLCRSCNGLKADRDGG